VDLFSCGLCAGVSDNLDKVGENLGKLTGIGCKGREYSERKGLVNGRKPVGKLCDRRV